MNNTCFVIWTHNRAAQAECLLSSIYRNFTNLPHIYVLHSASSQEYAESYRKIDKNDNLTLIEEHNNPIKFILDLCNKYKYLSFFADDNYFFRKVECREEFFYNRIFSFRLGLNTTCQDIFNDKWQRPLSYYNNNGETITWRWADYPTLDNYGYPMAFDGHVFNTKELKPLLKEAVHVKTPTGMESFLVGQRHRVTPFLSSFPHSCCVNIPVNNMSGNTASSKSLSVEEANKKFLEGYRLHFSVKEQEVIACHQVFEYEWKK